MNYIISANLIMFVAGKRNLIIIIIITYPAVQWAAVKT